MEISRATAEDLAEIGINNVLFDKRVVIIGIPKGDEEDIEQLVVDHFKTAMIGVHETLRQRFKDVTVAWK